MLFILEHSFFKIIFKFIIIIIIHFSHFCDVAVGIIHKKELAKFGYRPYMKVQKFKNPHVYYGNWLESSVQMWWFYGYFPQNLATLLSKFLTKKLFVPMLGGSHPSAEFSVGF